MLANTEGVMKRDNPEKLATYGTHDTGQINVRGLSFCIAPSVFSNIYLSCVPYAASFSGLSFFITPSVFSNIYLSCVLWRIPKG
jgi:hypothetical protein